jgi:hypothetical protein
MASLDDIATIQKNGVLAVNTVNQTLARFFGTTTSQTYSSNATVVANSGRLVNVSVTEAGTTFGAIHNCQTVADATAANKLATIGNTIGVFPVNVLFTSGLVVILGTGQQLNVTYSAGA